MDWHDGGALVVISSIDVGTNTVLLLVARFDDSGLITPLAFEQRIPRLGFGVDASRRLAREPMQRALAVLRDYRTILETYRPDATVVFGTSALRDASNREEFRQLVRDEAGFDLEVLSGADEALWTYRGAVSGLGPIGRAVVLDIGGGSTELASGAGGALNRRASLDVGSVRLTERFFRHDPPLQDELRRARALLQSELSPVISALDGSSTLVGVAGTVTSLAILAQGLPRFAVDAVAGYRMSRATVGRLFDRLSGMPAREIRQLSEIMEGRADVITAGALILQEVMDSCCFPDVVVSERGVRYGVAIREWEKARAGSSRGG